MNPYDAYVWNKMVNGKQFTIVFHIDDLLLSNKNPNIVTLYIRKLQQEYGSREDLTVTSGKIHEYLGMKNIVTLYIRMLQQEYDSRENLTVTRGKILEYLDITLDFRVKL